MFVRHKTELEGKAVYLEDPWGKVEFDTAESFFRNIEDLILCAKRERCKIIVTSRERVFEEFEKRKEIAEDLLKYASNLKVNQAYSEVKLSEMLGRYIEIFEPAWHGNAELRKIAFEAVGEKLMIPMSIKRLIERTKEVVDEESIEKGIEQAAEDTMIAFAREIKEMFYKGEYDKVVFLSFAYINIDFDVAKLCYESILKDLGYDLIKAKDFDDLRKEFKEVENTDFPSFFLHRRYKSQLSEIIKSPLASELISILSEIDPAKPTQMQKLSLSYCFLKYIARSESISGTFDATTNRLNYIHSSYWDAFRDALVDNNRPNNICKKIFSKVLFAFSKEDRGIFNVVDAIIRDFDRLPEDVKNLLFKLSEKNEIAEKITFRMIWGFSAFPEDARNKLLLKLSKKNELADLIIRIVKINYDRLPEDVRNLVLEKEDYLTYA